VARVAVFVDILVAKALVFGRVFVAGAFVFIHIIDENDVNVLVARGSESDWIGFLACNILGTRCVPFSGISLRRSFLYVAGGGG